jgi:hypothetical protein
MLFVRTMSIVFAFWRAIGSGSAPNLDNALLGKAPPDQWSSDTVNGGNLVETK